MSVKMIQCAKLGSEQPAIDPASADGSQAVRMCLLLGGPALRDRVVQSISQPAWALWKDHMMRVINEFRLDATSDESNAVLREQMEDFFFGAGGHVPDYVPEKK